MNIYPNHTQSVMAQKRKKEERRKLIANIRYIFMYICCIHISIYMLFSSKKKAWHKKPTRVVEKCGYIIYILCSIFLLPFFFTAKKKHKKKYEKFSNNKVFIILLFLPFLLEGFIVRKGHGGEGGVVWGVCGRIV